MYLRTALQPDLFAAGGDQFLADLAHLRANVVRFASGLSRARDFSVAAWAGHAIGVEAGELSGAALRCLAETVVDYNVPLFVDSGAFGAFMRGLRNGTQPDVLDFPAILGRYRQLLDCIATLNDATQQDDFETEDPPTSPEAAYARYHDERMGRGAQASITPPLLVMPDIVGDQLASLALITDHAAFVQSIIGSPACARAIIPIQRGPVPLATIYRQLVDLLGSDDFIVGVPSQAAGIAPGDFIQFLQTASPRAVHVLGAFADSRLTPRLTQIVDAGLARSITVSADGNPLRSIIIDKGQSAEGRRSALRHKLGAETRRQELQHILTDFGGLTGLRRQYADRRAEGRRRLVGLLSDFSNLTADEVVSAYGLAA